MRETAAKGVDRTLLRVGEAAESMGMSRSALYSAIQRGEVPVIRIGRIARIPATWLRRWIDAKVAAWEQATTGKVTEA
jgi:excisionase family DNA binding protein